jgi:DNA-binding MarR family transcriptional regulator
MKALTQADYTHLLEFRTALRRFDSWSSDAAARVGLTPGQHQLLLAVIGHPGERGPAIGEVADYLLVRHHSAVGLVDRAVKAGLVERRVCPNDARAVRLALTDEGRRRVEQLSEQHVAELARMRPLLEHLSADLDPARSV